MIKDFLLCRMMREEDNQSFLHSQSRATAVFP